MWLKPTGSNASQSRGTRPGKMGAPAEATVTLAEKHMSPEYKITGGGCDFSGGSGFGFLVKSTPIEGGFYCKAFPVNDNSFVIPTAYATACRIKHSESPNPAFSNDGLGGDSVAIARTSSSNVPYSIRVCNLSGGVPIAG